MQSRTLDVQSNRSRKSYFVRRSTIKQELPTDCSNFFKMTAFRNLNNSQVQAAQSQLNFIFKSQSNNTITLSQQHLGQNTKSYLIDSKQSQRIKKTQTKFNHHQLQSIETLQYQNLDSNAKPLDFKVKTPKKYSMNNISRNTESLQQLLLNINCSSANNSLMFSQSLVSPKHQNFNEFKFQSMPKRKSQTINLPSIQKAYLIDLNNNQNQKQRPLLKQASVANCYALIKNNPQLLSNRKKIDQKQHQKDPLYKIQNDNVDLRNIRKIKRYQKIWHQKEAKRHQKYRTMRSLAIGQSILNKSLDKSRDYVDKHNIELQKRRFDIKFDDYLRGGDKKLQQTIVKETKGVIAPHIRGLKGKGGKNIKTYFQQVFMVQEVYKISKDKE